MKPNSLRRIVLLALVLSVSVAFIQVQALQALSSGQAQKPAAPKPAGQPAAPALQAAPSGQAPQPGQAGFDEYVLKAMKDWEVPGLALAVVKDDKIIFAKGYGVRTLGEPTPVDEKTLFAIGSSSKAFTAAAIAMLVDDGKLKWDDPATLHLPGFELYDPYVTRELTVRDLLCHRSGLERADLLWYGSAYDRAEILRRIRYLKPSWSFRSRYGYQNIMFLAAGQIVQNVSGKTWDDFVAERIFKPLGMTSSNTSTKAFRPGDNVATPHGKIEKKVRPIPWRNIDNIAPAGSINSNVVEMAQWVRLQLGEGSYAGQRLLSSGAVREMWKSHSVIPAEPPWTLFFPDSRFLNYGLGWFLRDHRGRKVVEHGGAIDGMRALVSMVPEENFGLVLLTNLGGHNLPEALAYRIIDSYLGAPARDTSADFLKASKGFQEQQEAAQKKIEDARKPNTLPSLALEKYAGTYKSDLYGEAKVTYEGGKLLLGFGPAFQGELTHWHYDTFQVRWRDPVLDKALVVFTLDGLAQVDELTIDVPGTDLVFKRAPEAPKPAQAIALSEAELKKFVGAYQLPNPPLEVSVEFVGGKLKLVVPGQPVYSLLPIAPARFQVENVPISVFVEFKLEAGAVKSVTLEQGTNPPLTFLRKP